MEKCQLKLDQNMKIELQRFGL